MIKNVILASAILAATICVICLIIYMPRFFAWFHAKKPQKRLENEKKNKIAVIVPARNESRAIGMFVESVKAQTYDKECFDIHIIVKENDDPTINIAKEVNAIVHIAHEQTCKGDALEYCLKTILKNEPDKYDAYLIIDADCVMEKDMLKEMNNALKSGRQIIQAKKIVKNYYVNDKKANSLISCSNGLIWTIIDELGNRYKSEKNITNMTIGTGIMLRADVVKTIGGWPYRKTLTEDIELMYDCVIKGFTTFYYSYAKLYVEEATKADATDKRRTRWLNGVIDSKRAYKKSLKGMPKTKETKKNIYYACALEPVYAYIGTIVAFMLLQLIGAIALAFFGDPNWSLCLLLFALGYVVIYLSFLVLTIACIAVDGKYMKINKLQKLLVLLYHPIFYMGYIPIIFKALIGMKNKGWEVISRVEFCENSIKEEKS